MKKNFSNKKKIDYNEELINHDHSHQNEDKLKKINK